MARRTKRVIIETDDTEDRDRGKMFLLTEMDAEQAEEWGLGVLLALAAAGAEIPEDFEGGGMAAIAAMGLQAMQGLKLEVVKPFWKQMFGCVQIIPDMKHPSVVRELVADDIEEIATRLRLRKEIVELHVNFSRLEKLSRSMQISENQPLGVGVITRTSPGQ